MHHMLHMKRASFEGVCDIKVTRHPEIVVVTNGCGYDVSLLHALDCCEGAYSIENILVGKHYNTDFG